MFPGVTGSDSLVINQNGHVTRFPTPGAVEGRQQMFDRIRERSAAALSNLLSMDRQAPQLVRDFVRSSGTPGSVFNMFDANGDQVVNLGEIQSFQNGPRSAESPVAALIAIAGEEMKLDQLSPDLRSGISVRLTDLQGSPAAQFFSYDGLCDLTREYVAEDSSGSCGREAENYHNDDDDNDDGDGGIANAMCRKLRKAQTAEAHGNHDAKRRWLRAYVNLVEAQTGRSLTRSRATTLISLSQTL